MLCLGSATDVEPQVESPTFRHADLLAALMGSDTEAHEGDLNGSESDSSESDAMDDQLSDAPMNSSVNATAIEASPMLEMCFALSDVSEPPLSESQGHVDSCDTPDIPDSG